LNKTYSNSQKQNSALSNHEEIETKNERRIKEQKQKGKTPKKETGRTCQSMTFDDKLGFENLPT
jgi:hypothetical protein